MKDEMYVHLTVERRYEDGRILTRTFWGNADKAMVGNTVKIEEDDGTWTEPWIVVAIHGEPITKQLAMANSRLHTKQRKASDI